MEQPTREQLETAMRSMTPPEYYEPILAAAGTDDDPLRVLLTPGSDLNVIANIYAAAMHES